MISMTCLTTHTKPENNKKKGLTVTITSTKNQLVGALPKRKANTFWLWTNSVCLRLGMSTWQTQRGTSAVEDQKCKQSEINHSPRKCLHAFTCQRGTDITEDEEKNNEG